MKRPELSEAGVLVERDHARAAELLRYLRGLYVSWQESLIPSGEIRIVPFRRE